MLLRVCTLGMSCVPHDGHGVLGTVEARRRGWKVRLGDGASVRGQGIAWETGRLQPRMVRRADIRRAIRGLRRYVRGYTGLVECGVCGQDGAGHYRMLFECNGGVLQRARAGWIRCKVRWCRRPRIWHSARAGARYSWPPSLLIATSNHHPWPDNRPPSSPSPTTPSTPRMPSSCGRVCPAQQYSPPAPC